MIYETLEQTLTKSLTYALRVLDQINIIDTYPKPMVKMVDGTDVWIDQHGFINFYNEDTGEREIYESTVYAVTYIMRLMAHYQQVLQYGKRIKP